MRRVNRSGARRHHRRGSERGNALMELAMVMVPLTVVFGGIVDFGNIYQQRVSMRTGVREASWNAGRSIYGAPPTCGLTGGGGNGNARQVACMAKRRSELPASDLRVAIRVINPNTNSSGTFVVGNAVMVCMVHKVRSLTGLYSGLLGTKYERMRIDNVILDTSGGTLPTSWSETAFPGTNWTFCNPSQPATP